MRDINLPRVPEKDMFWRLQVDSSFGTVSVVELREKRKRFGSRLVEQSRSWIEADSEVPDQQEYQATLCLERYRERQDRWSKTQQFEHYEGDYDA